MLRILVIATLLMTHTDFAAASDEFSGAAAQAEAKSKANPKDDYPLKVMFNISKEAVRAMEDCGSEFPLGSTGLTNRFSQSLAVLMFSFQMTSTLNSAAKLAPARGG